MTVNETYEILKSDKACALMEKLYGAAAKENKARYEAVVKGLTEAYGDGDVVLFSSPGERRSAETTRTTTTERSWRGALTWTAWRRPEGRTPASSASSARRLTRTSSFL